jgi:hypothetical protein
LPDVILNSSPARSERKTRKPFALQKLFCKDVREPPEVLVYCGTAVTGVPFVHIEHVRQRHALDGFVQVPLDAQPVERACQVSLVTMLSTMFRVICT